MTFSMVLKHFVKTNKPQTGPVEVSIFYNRSRLSTQVDFF